MEAPKIPSFIKTKYRFKRFSFQPRYYDADKERLEMRKKSIEAEVIGDGNHLSPDSIERRARMKMTMQESWRNRRSKEYRKSNLRIAFIVGILVILLYIIKQNLGL
jgi:hypothetical protein